MKKQHRSYLKKNFWPNFGVGSLLQLLGIRKYACGLKFGPALNLNQNLFFEMASIKPEILIDYREKRCRLPDLLRKCGYNIVIQKLSLGDDVINREISIERKTGRDFVISIIDGRLFRQASKMKQFLKQPLYLVEGNPFESAIDITPEAVKGALISLQAIWYIPVLYAANVEQSCQMIQTISHQTCQRSHFMTLRQGYRPKKLRSRKLHLIQGLPNVGPLLAKRLLDHFKSVRNIMTANEIELQIVPGIGVQKASSIAKVLE